MTRRRLILLTVVVAGMVWGWLAYRDLDSARSHGEAAADLGDEAVDLAVAGDLSGARLTLQQAVVELDAVDSRIDGLTLFPIRLLPFAGTELRASDAGVAAARGTSLAALEVLDFLDADRPALLDGTTIDPAVFESLRQSLHRARGHSEKAQQVVDDAPRPRSGAIRRRLDRITELNDSLVEGLSAATQVADRLTSAIDGDEPYRVLVLFENGAELRATSGLMGFVALLAIDGGELALEQARDVHVLRDKDAAGDFLAVDAPEDYLNRYGEFLANTTLWLNVNLSPHFPTVAEVAGRLYELTTGIAPDAIVRVDLVGVGYILESFSTITVGGDPLDPAQLSTSFLVDSYRRFPIPELHNAYLASVFGEIFDQLLGGIKGDTGALIGALRRSFSESRLGLFTGDPVVDEALHNAGVDGSMLPGDPGDLEVSVQNFGANKVDLFTRTAIDITTTIEGCTLHGRVSATLTNELPDDIDFLPAGPGGRRGVWWTSFFVPRDATVVELAVDGESALGGLETEQGRPVAAVSVEAVAGTSVTATVEWTEQLVSPDYQLRIAAQPHIRAATLSINGEDLGQFTQQRTHDVPTDCVPAG